MHYLPKQELKFPPVFALVTGAAAMFFALACGAPEPENVQKPARVLYFESSYLEDEEIYSEAIDRLTTLIAENSGTRLGIFAYLGLADLFFKE